MITTQTQALMVLEGIQLIALDAPIKARVLMQEWLANRSNASFQNIVKEAEQRGAKLTADYVAIGEKARETWPRQVATAPATPAALPQLSPEQIAQIMRMAAPATTPATAAATNVIPIGGEPL